MTNKKIKKAEAPAPQLQGVESKSLFPSLDLYGWLENHFKAIFIVIVLFSIVTRFYHLDYKAFHHDESLYSKYVWDYGKGLGHKYHPLMHGPLMFMLNGTLLRHWDSVYVGLLKKFNKLDPVLPQSGYNDYTARMVPAILGVGVVLLCLALRDHFGKVGTLIAAAYFASSPSFTYYTRFMREDAYILFENHMAIVFFLLFISRKQWRWLYLSAAGLSFFWCTKENHFVHTFEYLTFFILLEIFNAFVPTYKNNKTGAWLRRGFGLMGNWLQRMSIYAWLYKFQILLATGIFFSIFYVIYTDVGKHAPGFLDGLYRLWVPYWWNQNKIQRVRGDYHYHLWRMVMYELPLVLGYLAGLLTVFRKYRKHFNAFLIFTAIIVIAFMFTGHIQLPAYKLLGAYGNLHEHPEIQKQLNIFGVLLEVMHMQVYGHLYIFLFVMISGFWAVFVTFWDRIYIPAFFIYTSMFNFLAYSYLGEKVSWLTIHIQYPMVMVLAYYAVQWLRENKRLVPALILLCLAFQVYANYGLNFYKNGVNEANPAEIIVYTQTHDDVKDLNELIYKTARETGLGQNIPLAIQGSAAWPYSWYLRDYKRWFTPEGSTPSADALIIVNDWEKKSDYSYILRDQYKMSQKKLRAWDVLPNLDEQYKNGKPTLGDMVQYFLFRLDRTPMVPTGSTDMAVFVRNDIAAGKYDAKFGADQSTRDEIRKKAQSVKPVSIQPVQVIGSQGAGPGQMNEPRAIALDSKGGFYIADTKNNRVLKFSASGTFEKAWGGTGANEGQFDQPSGIAVDKNDNVFVADTWHHRIQKFDANGTFIKMWGRGGADNDGDMFWAPKGMAFDSQNNLYVANTGLHRINKFTADGEFIKKFGVRTQEGSTQLVGFFEPVGIAIGPNDKVYVADTFNQRIVILDKDLTPLDQIKVPGWDNQYTEPFIALYSDGTMFITDAFYNRIQRFNAAKELVQNWGTAGNGAGQFNLPRGLAISGDTLYVVDCQNYRVQKFNLKDLPPLTN